MSVKQVIIIRRDLKMRRGKEIAQGAHAAMAWLTKRLILYPEDNKLGIFTASLSKPEQEWVEGSFRKVTVQVNTEEELISLRDAARTAGLKAYLITDSGLTEFDGVPTHTALAIGPDYDEKIDLVTGDLKLY